MATSGKLKHNSLMAVAAVNSARISIVIPALNEAGCITRTLDKLQAMRRRGHELIVVDGGSTDNTLAVSEALADQLIQSPQGRASQMRAGAAAANGSVIWFLHADTVPVNNADVLILSALEQHESRWGRFDVLFSSDRLVFKMIALLMNYRSRLSGIATGDQGIFIARTLYEQVGGIPDIPLMEDIALSRILKHYSRPFVINQKLTSSPRRWEKYGIAKTILKMWGLRFAYFVGIDPVLLAKYYAVNNT